ncbi:hypothetical protein G7Y79_00041g077770 [Physcia stellaris]|nr:hypothetical protein G7Y79_00041g077770 [Physcia stellaris]
MDVAGNPSLVDGTLLAVQSLDAESIGPPSNGKPINTSGKIHDKAGKLESEEIILPSTPVKSRICGADVPEPRLPSTPRQLGLEPPAPKSANDLSVSPKERSKRKRLSNAKSSPLKPKEGCFRPPVIKTQSESMLGHRNPSSPCSGNLWYIHPGVSLVVDSTPGHAAGFDAKCKALSAREDSPLDETAAQSLTNFPITPMKSLSELAVQDSLYASQAETSLVISASDEIGLDPVNSPDVMSRDVILRSTDGLLEVKLRFYLKSHSKKVASVDVVRLSPWASPELGAWLKAPIADRNQGSIIKAVGRYWTMAETRALCWYQCKQNTSRLIGNTEGSQESSHEELRDVSTNPATPDISTLDSSQSIDAEVLHRPSQLKEYPLDKCSYILGHKHLRFTDGTVTLHVSWDIQFMPSGEVTSIVATKVDVPETWADGPDLSDLPRISEAFVRLVESGKSVYEAIRRIAEIVFPA